MSKDFIIKGIEKERYHHLFSKSTEELEIMGIRPYRVDECPGYPCRVSLEDARIGEKVLLLNHQHHQTTSPYRANGPVFIRKNAEEAALGVNEVPEMLRHRLLSLRIYDNNGIMIDARTMEGRELRKEIEDIFRHPDSAYIHIHNAGPGCYNCSVNRVYKSDEGSWKIN